jgi:hypothetical protein
LTEAAAAAATTTVSIVTPPKSGWCKDFQGTIEREWKRTEFITFLWARPKPE